MWLYKWILRPKDSLLHPRYLAESSFRSVFKIPYCCRYMTFGLCFSSNVADHFLKTAKDLWLGKPLPYQLPNLAQAHLSTKKKNYFFYSFRSFYSTFYIDLKGRFSRVTHQYATFILIIKFTFNSHVLKPISNDRSTLRSNVKYIYFFKF